MNPEPPIRWEWAPQNDPPQDDPPPFDPDPKHKCVCDIVVLMRHGCQCGGE